LPLIVDRLSIVVNIAVEVVSVSFKLSLFCKNFYLF
jgi:hypothetical protein